MDAAALSIAMGLLPLAFLGVLRARGQRRDVAWLWLAIAFAVSWLADVVSSALAAPDRWIVSLVYPIAQAAIVGRVLLTRRRAIALLGLLVLTGCVAVLWRGVEGPDAVLRSIAWLSVVAIVADRPELPARLQWCLFVYFGVGWLSWIAHVEWIHEHPHAHGIAPTWYAYQGVRLAGLLLFCWAAMKPGPSLRLVRACA